MKQFLLLLFITLSCTVGHSQSHYDDEWQNYMREHVNDTTEQLEAVIPDLRFNPSMGTQSRNLAMEARQVGYGTSFWDRYIQPFEGAQRTLELREYYKKEFFKKTGIIVGCILLFDIIVLIIKNR